jgi:hypothetical protein
MRTVLFWAIKQRVVVLIHYRRFGTTYRSQRQGSRIQDYPRRAQFSSTLQPMPEMKHKLA